jgi:hypothetical protein
MIAPILTDWLWAKTEKPFGVELLLEVISYTIIFTEEVKAAGLG